MSRPAGGVWAASDTVFLFALPPVPAAHQPGPGVRPGRQPRKPVPG